MGRAPIGIHHDASFLDHSSGNCRPVERHRRGGVAANLGDRILQELVKPPVEFGPRQNVLWKTAMGSGLSSPIIAKGRVFLTEFDRPTKQLVAENSVRVENTDVRSFVRIVVFPMSPCLGCPARFACLYISDPHRSAGRDRRSAPPDRRAPMQLTASSPPQAARPTALDPVVALVAGWRRCVYIVKPDTVIRWHRTASLAIGSRAVVLEDRR